MTHVSFISPMALWRFPEYGWAPSYFVGPSARVIRASQAGLTIDELNGQVLEGWRISSTLGTVSYDPRSADVPIYRQSHIQPLCLLPDGQHWRQPVESGPWCVQTGDVVINKMAPIRAGIVSPLCPRHPIDGNCLIVRGLGPAAALWLAICLNDSAYANLLLAGQTGIQRLSQAALKGFRVPPVPIEAENLSRRLFAILDDIILAREIVHRLKAEASEASAITVTMPDLRDGIMVPGATVGVDNWLPSTVVLRALQAQIAADYQWVAVGSLVSLESRTRLAQLPPNAHVLRLGDVADDFFVPAADAKKASETAPANRTLAQQLLPGDVLVSTLGNSFRTAYADSDIQTRIYPSDAWVRLRFNETPAAWALLLSTPIVKSQVARLAIGVMQQFVPPSSLLDLLVPTPDRSTRDRWQRQFDQHHTGRRIIEQSWAQFQKACRNLFDVIHDHTTPRSFF